MSKENYKFRCRASALGKIMGVRGLGKTGQGYVEEWLKEQIYGVRKEFTSKYTDKGNANEDIAIDMAATAINEPMLLKNDEWFENDYIHGTPDVVLPKMIIDVKCSWDAFSFPLFQKDLPNKDYYWQLQAYMWLTGKTKGKVIYCLTETDHDNPQYKGVPNDKKIKAFDVAYDEAAIEKIKERVNECNEYLKQLTNGN